MRAAVDTVAIAFPVQPASCLSSILRQTPHPHPRCPPSLSGRLEQVLAAGSTTDGSLSASGCYSIARCCLSRHKGNEPAWRDHTDLHDGPSPRLVVIEPHLYAVGPMSWECVYTHAHSMYVHTRTHLDHWSGASVGWK